MSTRILTLPSDCVQLIFDRIPTYDLLQVRGVSRAWQRHQQLNCRGRKSLIILQEKGQLSTLINKIYYQPFVHIDRNGNSRNHKSFIAHNQISILLRRSPKVKFLAKTFPHLHTLIVRTDRVVFKYIRSFTQLITRYSSKLVTLQLYFEISENEIRSRSHEASVNNGMGNLINQLNLLSSLQHLIVSFQNESYEYFIKPQIEEPKFLTRIKEFYFNFDSLEVMLDWAQKYDKAGKLDQLERFYLFTYDDIFGKIGYNQIQQFPLANRFSFCPHECRDMYNYDENYLKRIVFTFPSLISFSYTIKVKSINSLPKLTTILSPLTKLVHLNLQIYDVPSNEPLNPNSTPQLTSLKAIGLTFGYKSITFLQTFCQTQVSAIVHCFPNLESITMKDYDDEKTNLQVCQFFDHLKVAYGRPFLRTKY